MRLENVKLKLVTFVVLLFFTGMNLPLELTAQTNTGGVPITGVILDQKGEAIIGANVVVKGTDTGTVTDADGKFSLQVPNENATLQISYLGYKAQEIRVGNKRKIDVTLAEDNQLLNEVVVVGYGTMKKKDLTGAITSVNSEAIAKSVPTSIDQVLQGRAAGVQVQQSSGMPGAASSVRIRGVSSITSSNEPIYVIDGVIMSQGSDMNSNVLSSINPADIVSIDILKDASATAIYGSRASNGVVIVTTRRGEAGHSIISFNSYVGWQQIPKKLDVTNLQQYAEHRNTMTASGINVPYINSFARPDLLGEGTNWQNELFKTAMMYNYNLSISGGTDKTTYNIAAAYLNQDGIAAGSGFKRWNLTGNVDTQVKPWAKVGFNMAFSNTFQNLTVSDQSLISSALRITPDVPVRNVDGTFASSDDNSIPANPVALASLKQNNTETFGVRGNSYLELAPKGVLTGLTYRFEVAFDFNLNQNKQFMPTYYLSETRHQDYNQANSSKQFNKYWTYRNILTYDRKFADIHHITAMLGQEYQQSRWDNLAGMRTGFQTNTATDLNLGDATTAGANGYSGVNAILSQFGRLFYSLQDIYMLTATLRHDGTSKFAPQNRWGWFPSAALGWRISEYNFLKENKIINNLKLRLGWGLVGNQSIYSENAWYAVYSPVTTTYGTGLYPSNTPNPNLKWESTTSTNIGMDLGLFKNRIEIIFDWFNRKTNNLLLQAISLPNYVGVSDLAYGGSPGKSDYPWVNLGSMQNRGVELTLNTQNVVTNNFKWSSNIVFSSYRNKVLKMDTPTGNYPGYTTDPNGGSTYTTNTVVGKPIGQFYGWQVIGRFEKATDFWMVNSAGQIVRIPVQADQNGLLPIAVNGVWIGDYIYRDVNNDGVIDTEDNTAIGNPHPKFTFGFGNTLTYKNLDLTLFFTGSYGNDVVNYIRRMLSNPFDNTTNHLTEALNYAKLGLIDPNGPNDYRNVQIIGGDPHAPRMPLISATSNYDYAFSDRFIEDGSYIRLQNVSIGYTLPQTWLNHTGISLAKIYANLQNVYTWTKYRGFDPEVGSTGIDNGRYPSPRIYTVGINITF